MREIKFRAWDKKKKRMCQVEYLGIGSNGYFCVCENQSELDGKDECEVMQYVGLLDKNGKEIYADDLLKDKRGNIQIVLWSERDCGWYIKPLNDNTHDECWHRNLNVPKVMIDKLEIVGNKWENKELLNENNG